MTFQMIATALVLIAVTVLFLFDKVPMGLVSMGAAVVLAILGVIEPSAIYAPMASSSTILIMTMIILGYALFHSGAAKLISQKIIKITGRSEQGVMIAVMLAGLLLSSVCSGVAVVAVMLPIVIGICRESNISISRQLIPLSFAASIGCNLTLVGAASNVITAGVYEDYGLEFLSFLDLGKAGLPLCVIFLIYFLLIGKRLLRKGDTSDMEYIQEMTSVDNETEIDMKKVVITVAIMVAVAVAMALDLKALPMFFVSTIGVLLLRVTGILDEKEFFKSIDLSTLFIVVGLTALASAVSSSGLGAKIANASVHLLGENPSKMGILAVVLIVTVVLTNIMTNTGTAGLVTPIFIPIAQMYHVNVVAVGVAICLAASMPFLTPYGSGTNFLLIRPGRLTVRDFFVPGIGLTVICIVASLFLIPIFWPL